MASLKQLPASIKNALIVIGFIIVGILCYYLASVIYPFLISLVIAYVLNPLVRGLVNKKVPRPWAVLLVFIFTILIVTIFVVPLSISIISEAGEMFTKLSNLKVDQLTENLKESSAEFFKKTKNIPYLNDYLQEFSEGDKLRELAANAVVIIKDTTITGFKRLIGFVGSAFSGMINMLLIPVLVFYILLDMDAIYESFKMLLPPNLRRRTLVIIAKIDKQLHSLLRGQLIANSIFAIIMTLGLWLSDLNFFLFLGPLSGIANFIPYLGGLFTVFLAAFVAIAQFGFSQALLAVTLKVLITIAVVQTIEGWYLQPNVVGENAGLHPLVVMLALTIAASLGGIPGMLLAVPITIILKVLGQELYQELYEQNEHEKQPA
ncbi:MAG: AI-2E family transporter [Candidatus Rifleibacteriota bacterium]